MDKKGPLFHATFHSTPRKTKTTKQNFFELVIIFDGTQCKIFIFFIEMKLALEFIDGFYEFC